MCFSKARDNRLACFRLHVVTNALFKEVSASLLAILQQCFQEGKGRGLPREVPLESVGETHCGEAGLPSSPSDLALNGDGISK